MLRQILAILDRYESQGYKLTLRQLYYQLVKENVVPNTEKSYKNIGKLVSDGRLAGWIDWEMIQDRSREMVKNPHWLNPQDFIKVVMPQYRFNLWNGQKNYVEVMVEKDALSGVLEPVCRTLDVPFSANRGYSSSSTMYEASRRFIKEYEAGKELHIIYLGDHDPSGIDMTRDIEERMDRFVKVTTERENEIGPNEIPAVLIHRIALNMDQIRKLNPPKNPAKLTDTRSGRYVQNYGRDSWELDAIEPAELEKLLRGAITSFMDVELFTKNVKKMNREKRKLLKAVKLFQ